MRFIKSKMSGRPMDGFPEGIFRSNWTDMWGHSHSGQCQIGNAKPRCAEFQLNAIECLEAYGAHRGRAHCQDFLDDYVECLHAFNQVFIHLLMYLISIFNLSSLNM